MIDLLQRMGSAVCHRMAERSLYFDGMQMPLCARCTGIYTGAFFAFCFFFLKKRMGNGKPFSLAQAILTGCAVLPIGIDGIGSYLGFWESSQLMRLFSGSLVGAVVPGFLLMAVNVEPKKGDEGLIYEKTAELLALMAFSVCFGMSLYGGMPVGAIAAVISVAGEVLLWGGVVWLVLKSMGKEKNFPYWRVSIAFAGLLLFLAGGVFL